MLGYAVDLFPMNGEYDAFVEFVKDYLQDKAFDQCIVESNGLSRGLHIGLYYQDHSQRRMQFVIKK